MKQRTICKTLAVAVIILFIGLGVQPAVATVQIDEDAGIIQKIRTQIDRIKNKLDIIEKVNSKSSKLNPEYIEKFHEIYNEISTINEKVNNIKTLDFPFLKWLYELILNLNFFFIVLPICLILGILYAFFVVIPFMILLIIYVMSGPGPP
jgi:pilus assembly protein TadC